MGTAVCGFLAFAIVLGIGFALPKMIADTITYSSKFKL